MSHHAIANDNDLLKAIEDVATSGHEWAVKVNSATNGDSG